MELRDIFSYDILSNPDLLAVWTYCVREAQPFQSYPIHDGEVIELNPYEVLIDWDRMEHDVKLPRERCTSSLIDLQKMRRLEFRPDKGFCRVTVNIRYPIVHAAD